MTAKTPPSRLYASRVARGRPQMSFSLPQATADAINRLAESMGVSKSEVVSLAIAGFEANRSK